MGDSVAHPPPTMKGAFIVALLACLCILVHAGGFTETVYTATLSNNQEVPPIRDPPDTSGVAVCVLSRYTVTPTVDCEVQHDVINPTSASIRLAPRGQVGAPIFLFSGSIDTNFRQSFTLTEVDGYTSAQQINDFLSGNWYINIFSENYPNGEVRGQIEQTDRFYARLSVTNTIPRASGSSAKGIAVGTYSENNPSREITFDLVHSVTNAQANGIEIHTGAPGQTGPSIYTFDRATSPFYNSLGLTINEQTSFYSDLLYLNVASTTNPTGEIRGQMITIDYINELSFTARLDASQVVPATFSDNRGGGLFAYDCTTKILEYMIMHDIPDANGAFLGAGNMTVRGTPLFSLPASSSPIFGAIQLSLQEELFLYTSQMYVAISSVNYTEAEIRGQITVENDWWAYLSGSNVVSAVTTPAVGLATMRLYGQQNRRVDYSIFHSVQFPLRATMHVARVGNNGPVTFEFPTVYSPVRGNDIVLDDDDLQAFVTDASYITVTSTGYPFLGEIRGQIRRVNPCVVDNDNSLTVSVSGNAAGLPDESTVDEPVVEDDSSSFVRWSAACTFLALLFSLAV